MLESRIEKMVGELRSQASLPLAIELWNGKRYALGEQPTVTLRVPAASAVKYLAKANLAALGEAYVEGHIDVEGPIGEAIRAAESLARRFGGDTKGRAPQLFRNIHTKKKDAEAIRYHYDVSNDFYALWLDPRMVYSCAYYKSGDESIATAQEQKLDHICRKLMLQPGDRFLDIGCGWGALVMHAAERYGVRALGITLSKNQHALANERIRAAGLQDKCEVRVQDYRDVPGEGVFDKIASIGMFEHVGLKNLPVYFGTIRRLLAEGGIVLNHGITSVDPDSRSVGLGGGDFIGKYVFPHGELPHLSLVIREMGAAGLEVMDSETLRLHYAKTLRQWSERLEANLDQGRAFVGEKRLRIWRTYLAGCAHAFAEGWVSIQQVLAVKGGDPINHPLPWTREYMYGS
ncbi:MAG: class I SAM-dependent methyltransferase [Betaproteobacteria bacterium]|nr:class I SAM-dependent methyltransferase [Betaproteobacteria bacterium]